MVDTGAQYSVLNRALGKLNHQRTSVVQGATGLKVCPWTSERTVNLGKHQVTHSFLVVPESPAPLLGRDLLTKVRARIHFEPEGIEVTDGDGQSLQVLTLSLADEYRLYKAPGEVRDREDMAIWLDRHPSAWAETAGIGLAKHLPPVVVELKATAQPIRVRQYPIPEDARRGIAPHIHRLLAAGILKPCHSAWNTPLLPVRKPGGSDYRPVQDLRKVNERVEDIHPTVPNPYTLLSHLTPSHIWYTTLDLQDAYFTIPLAEHSQPLFAFEWQEVKRGKVGQLTWTRLPQGFKNSPTLFNEALSQDLEHFRQTHPRVTLLQYVDDLLLAAATREECLEATGQLLEELGTLGYRASAKRHRFVSGQLPIWGTSYMMGLDG